MPTKKRKRSNFNDRQKAEIFVRDRATCAFSGISLWILDRGASESFDVDWVDHIKPSARGGKSVTDNGICASSFFNSKKKDNGSDNCYFFRDGKPTEDFYLVYEQLPPNIADHLRRFASLEIADWYFNRALFHLLLAVSWLDSKAEGIAYVRGIEYRAKASLRFLEEWRALASDATAKTFLRRRLIAVPLGKDQKLMLSLANIQTVEEFTILTKQLLPYYQANTRALVEVADIPDATHAKRFLEKVKKSPSVSPRIKSIVSSNIRYLFP
ncbi:MAG: hypothetical protein WCS85_04190 [Candidatus Peribacteraceae bacterium]|jgi:hypothetical protein